MYKETNLMGVGWSGEGTTKKTNPQKNQQLFQILHSYSVGFKTIFHICYQGNSSHSF